MLKNFEKIKLNCMVLNEIVSNENNIRVIANTGMIAFVCDGCGICTENIPEKVPLPLDIKEKFINYCNQWLTEHKQNKLSCSNICGDLGGLCNKCQYNGIIESPLDLGDIVNVENNSVKFPIDSLPYIFKEYTLRASQAVKCPPDFIATILLACAGSLIGTARQIKVSPTWLLYPNLYACLVGSPSSKKSPAISQIMKYIHEIEETLEEQYQTKLSEYELKLKQNKNQGKITIPTKPTIERIITNNTTVEALVELLSQNPRGILLVSDELKSWINSMGEYKRTNNADKQFYLTAWNGDRYVQDRKGKPPIIANKTLISVLGGVQPSVIRDMDDIGDGFFERIIFSYPDNNNYFGSTDFEVDSNLENQLRTCFNDLYKFLYSGSKVIELEPDARQRFKDWEKKLEDMVNFKHFNPIFEALYCKISGTTAKLALIIHTVKAITGNSSEKVTKETMISAITITNYYLQHSKQVIGLISKEVTSKITHAVYKWICKKGYTFVTPSQVSKYKVGGIKTADEAREILNQLIHDKKMIYDTNKKRYLVIYEN
ncbi:MAG: YfjI family protein [Candidatus Gastranaerophilales bacterium]|nr:YfjI family protein [Candidatus Gastranaerophilales bacterium]